MMSYQNSDGCHAAQPYTKAIARMLKHCLKLFVPDVVQLNQMDFLKDGFLCENIMLVFELLYGFHKKGPLTRGCIQIDQMKAYDSLN